MLAGSWVHSPFSRSNLKMNGETLLKRAIALKKTMEGGEDGTPGFESCNLVQECREFWWSTGEHVTTNEDREVGMLDMVGSMLGLWELGAASLP